MLTTVRRVGAFSITRDPKLRLFLAVTRQTSGTLEARVSSCILNLIFRVPFVFIAFLRCHAPDSTALVPRVSLYRRNLCRPRTYRHCASALLTSTAGGQLVHQLPIMSAALSSYIMDLLWSFTNCLNCFPSNPALSINGRSFKILRLLGEVLYILQASEHPNAFI